MDPKIGQLVVGSVVVCVPLRPELNSLVFNMGMRWMAVVVSLNGKSSKHLFDIESYTVCLDRMLKDEDVTQEEHAAFMGQVLELKELGFSTGFEQLIELACERARPDLMENASFQVCNCGSEIKHGALFVGGSRGEKVFSMEDLFRQCEFYTHDGTITTMQAFGVLKQARDMGLPVKSPVDTRAEALLDFLLGGRFERVEPESERSAGGPT